LDRETILDGGGKRGATPLTCLTGTLGWSREALLPLRSASAIHDPASQCQRLLIGLLILQTRHRT